LAIEAVNGGSTTITRTANLHGVPRQTIQDRIYGRVKHGINPGPKPYLSSTEEKYLVGFLVDTSKMGNGLVLNRLHVKAIAAFRIHDKGALNQDKVLDDVIILSVGRVNWPFSNVILL